MSRILNSRNTDRLATVVAGGIVLLLSVLVYAIGVALSSMVVFVVCNVALKALWAGAPYLTLWKCVCLTIAVSAVRMVIR